MFDILIINGTLADGRKDVLYKADIGIKDDRIVFVGDGKGYEAKRIIDAAALIVSPGFVNMHSHDDLVAIADPKVPYAIMQGVTTNVIGMCGIGPAPFEPSKAKDWENWAGKFLCDDELPWTWKSYGDFLDRVEAAEPAINLVGMTTHGAIRSAVMGLEDRLPTTEELCAMQNLLAESLDQGARGISTGLIYVPNVYSDTHELIEMCKIAGKKGGQIVPHIRNMGATMDKAVDEFIHIAEQAEVDLHISHLNVIGKTNWPILNKVFESIDKGCAKGITITYDTHTYTGVSSMMNILLPPWANAGGREVVNDRLKDLEVRKKIKKDYERNFNGEIVGWEFSAKFADWPQISIAGLSNENYKMYIGKNLAEIGEDMGCDPYDAAMNLMMEDPGTINIAVEDGYSIENVREGLRRGALVGADGIPAGAAPHPRLYGTMGRYFEEFVRKEALLTLPKAVSRITREACELLKLQNRGVLQEDYYADITMFDINSIHDNATDANPRQHPTGIRYVIVNGKLTVDDCKQLETRNGVVFR